MKKKVLMRLFTIGLFAGIVYGVVNIITGGNFDYSKSVILKENQQYLVEEKVGNGCYEVGFYSKDRLFYSPMHLPYTFKDSKFEVVFLNNKDEVIKKTTVDSSSGLQHGFAPGRFGSETTNVALDLLKSPFNGSYSLKILIKIDKLANHLKDKEVYLYLHKYAKSCDLNRLDYMNKKHTYPIKRKETNATLIPLYDALIAKDTQKVKNILSKDITLCKANFIGDRTLFHYSAFYNDLPTLQYTVKVCDVSALHREDILQKTPVRYAIENNATKVLDFLFKQGSECPGVIENIYLKDYMGGGISYKRATWGQNIAMFIHEYNLPEAADVLLKYQCMDANEKRKQFGREITWIEMMERDMRGTQQMKNDNDPRWKKQKDYTKLIEVFKKYTKQDINVTQRINDGR